MRNSYLCSIMAAGTLAALGLAAATGVVLAQDPPPSGGTSINIQIEGSEADVDSSYVDVLLFQADLAMQQGDFAAAIRTLRQAMNLAPDREECHLYMARALTTILLNGQAPNEEAFVGQALRHYRWVLDRTPDNPEALQGIQLIAQHTDQGDRPDFQTERGRKSWAAGERALDAGDYEAAATAFRDAVRAEPQVAGVHRALGDAYRLGGRNDQAEVTYRRAIQLHDQDFRAHGGLGLLLEARGDSVAAFESFRRAFELDTSYADGRDGIVRLLGTHDPATLQIRDLSLLGRAHLAAEHWPEAERILALAVESDPSALNLKSLGVAKYFLGRPEEARPLFETALEAYPGDPEVLYYLGGCYLRLGEVEAGREALAEVLSIDPTNPNALKLLGLSLSDEPGHEEESIDLLERARDMGASLERLPCVLGMLEARLGRDDAAAREFEACLREVPGFPPAHLGLGLIADERDHHGQAIVHFEQYLNAEPDQPGILMRLGVAYLREGRDEEAYDRLRRIMEVEDTFTPPPGDEITHARLLEMAAFYLATVRALDDAIFVGEKLLGEEPENAIYNNNLAMAYADANADPERAHELAVKANALEPDNPGHLDTLAWALIRLQRYEEAEATLRKAVALAGGEGRDDLSEIYYHFGVLYRGMGRETEARDYLNRALENPPTPFLRDVILAELERLP